MTNPGKRPAGVEPVRGDLHKVVPTYTGDEIALGITYQVAIGERRSIVVQTHVGQSTSEKDINDLFDRLMKATDRVNAKYRLEELQREVKLTTNQFALSLDNITENKTKWQEEWERKGRRGTFEPAGNQREIMNNVEKQHERFRQTIANLEVEIAELEKIVAGK